MISTWLESRFLETHFERKNGNATPLSKPAWQGRATAVKWINLVEGLVALPLIIASVVISLFVTVLVLFFPILASVSLATGFVSGSLVTIAVVEIVLATVRWAIGFEELEELGH